MIKKQKQRRPVDKVSWMTTYSDVVTLLLCFFVLLYAASTLDSDKWQLLVKSLNPFASAASQDKDEEPESEPEDRPFDQLYEQMKRYVEDSGMTNDVEVQGGVGYTFIVFKNNILFDGDKYELKPEGEKILDFLCGGVASVSDMIKELQILGHTNQADPNRPNDTRGDRFLASNRATEVLVYIQEKNIIEPKKLVGIGYGQFYPAAPFEREEDRLKNRRVEILITETNAADISLEWVYTQIDRENNNI